MAADNKKSTENGGSSNNTGFENESFAPKASGAVNAGSGGGGVQEGTGGTGGTAVAKVKDTASTLLDQAKSAAGDAYAGVSEKAASTIEEKKAGFANEIEKAAQAARRLGGAITEGEDQGGITQAAARYTETGAQKLEEMARYFETTDLRGMSRDIESYARRNPAIFLGAAFGLGIIAARFIKSAPPVVKTPQLGAGGGRQPKAVDAEQPFAQGV